MRRSQGTEYLVESTVAAQILQIAKKFFAIACIAVCCVQLSQSALVALDRFEHAMGIEHEANNLAGTVQASHTDELESQTDSSDHDRGHPLSHTHHADVSGDTYSVPAHFKSAMFGKELVIVCIADSQRPANFHVTPDQPPKV